MTTPITQARFEHIRATLLPYLKSVGFRETALQWLPASGPLGENLVGPPTVRRAPQAGKRGLQQRVSRNNLYHTFVVCVLCNWRTCSRSWWGRQR